MSSYTIRDLDPDLLAHLRARATEDGLSLSAAVLRVLHAYAAHGSPATRGATGGAARAARMSPEDRSAASQRAALSRWLRPYGATITPEGWLCLSGSGQPTVTYSWHGDALWRRGPADAAWVPEPHVRGHLALDGPVGQWLRVVMRDEA